jgi:hypothetical protein
MWQCTKRRESVEDSFDVCWSCGTSRERVEDPSFQEARDAAGASVPEEEQLPQATAPRVPPGEDAIRAGEPVPRLAPAVERRCPHCGAGELIRAVRLGPAAEAGSIGPQYRTLLVLVGTEPLYADLCKSCGSVARLYVRETDRNWLTG